MYPPTFDYIRANSVEEAVQLLQQHGDDAKLIAGGHSLIPAMKLRLMAPAVLIDISRLALDTIMVDRGYGLRVGALATHDAIARNSDVRELTTALAEAASVVGDVQVRNRGTIGGNLAHADPASDLPAAVLALGGELHVTGPNGTRTIPADDFFLGLFTTALEPHELITSVGFPGIGFKHGRSAYVKFPHPASGYAVVGVAAYLETDGDTITAARVAANGAFDHATRLTAVEEALAGAPLSVEALSAAAEKAADGFGSEDFMADLFASADYRAHLLKVYTKRALLRAAGLA